MGRKLFVFLAAIAWSTTWAQGVSIQQFNPQTGSSTVVQGASAAVYNTSYVYSPSNANSAIIVNPLASGNLGLGTYFDGMSYSGPATCANCRGQASVYLPTVTMQESFRFLGAPGQIVPWTVTLTAMPEFRGASNASDYIDVELGVGGNLLGGPIARTACFSRFSLGATDPCVSLEGNAGPNFTPYTFTVSGTVATGGSVNFGITTSGSSNFFYGPGTANLRDSFDLDPLISFIVPAGTQVQSASGVFPVTFISAVPEPETYALFLLGLGALGMRARRREHRRAK